jgi:outer membrane immunogenic protein
MQRSRVTLGLAACLYLGLSAVAPAADMVVKAPPVVLFSWAGWYGGVNTGYSWGSSRATTDSTPLAATYTQSVTHRGWEASVEGGYCWQQTPTTNLVGCLEVRYDFPRERSRPTSFDIPLTTITNQTNVDPLLIGPHLGVLTDSNHTLLYVAGGLAVGEVGGSAIATGTGGTSTANPSSKWSAGWFAGVGAEHMIDRHWSVKFEYDYVSLASNGVTGLYTGANYATFTGSGATATLGGHAYDNIMTIGINYHVGM